MLSPTAPPPLTYSSMEFDPVSQGLILFGGLSDSGAVNYTWEYKNYVWLNLTPNLTVSPPPRYHASLAASYLPAGLVLFGGETNGTTVLGDTWYWNGTGWAQEDLAGSQTPPPRAGASFTYDAEDLYAVLFGGTNTVINFNDTWAYTGLVWGQIHPHTSPPGRYFASMSWDASDIYVVLFGGQTTVGTGLDDTWSYSAGNWTNLHPGTPPSDRILAGAAYDYQSSQLLLFGGFNPENCTALDDTDWYSGGLWRLLTSPQQGYPAPSPRDGMAMASDLHTRYVVLFGGETGTCSPLQNANDTWIYGPWTGPPPSALSITLTASPSSGPSVLVTTLSVRIQGGVAPYTLYFTLGDGSPVQTEITPNGFVNFTDGYDPSGNYEAVATAVDTTAHQVSADTIINVGSVMVPDWLPPRDTYPFKNYGSYWSGGGNCYGISSSEILYWEHDILGWGNTPYLPSAAASTSSLAAPANSSFLNSTTLAIMEHQTLNAPNQWPWYYWSSSLSGNWAFIISYLKVGLPVMMGLGWNDLHAVVAYGEQLLPNGTFLIDISDPNAPLITTHAWYDPNAGTFFYDYGYVWHGFDYLAGGIPQQLQPSWFGAFLYPAWNYTDFPILSNGYYFVSAGQPVTVKYGIISGTDSFTAPGDSQTFVKGITNSAGIEEGSVQVYAIPIFAFGGPPPVVSDPGVGPSDLQVLTTGNASGALTENGFSVAVDSLGAHDFTVQGTANGLLLRMGNTTNESGWTNLSLYDLQGSHIVQLNASLLPIPDGAVANFTVHNWAGLASSTVPSVLVTLETRNGATSHYELANGQVGWTPTPASTHGGNGTATSPPFYSTPNFLIGLGIGALAMAAIAVVAVIFIRKGKQGDGTHPPSP
ncbi:MAG TPA: hypothetical protein VK424_00755 [Thermoplasmata archaeon]|nr:hypothetical protein [Thermoplasmata archaeon]